MGLDIFIGINKRTLTHVSLSIGDNEHDAMFSIIKCNGSFKTIRKIEDFYSDSVISNHELSNLMREIEQIKRLSNDKNLKNFMDKFVSIASKALNSEKNLIFLSD